MRYVLGYCERYDFDAELTQKRSENTQKIRKNRIIDDSKILHCFFEDLCSVNETEYLFKDIRLALALSQSEATERSD